MRQAIIWTNADRIRWRIYAAQDGDELTFIWIIYVKWKNDSQGPAPLMRGSIYERGENQTQFNSSSPSAAYMRQWSGSAMVQVMAWRRTVHKALPEPMLVNCQSDSWEQISVKFESELFYFHWRKLIWKWHLPKWRPCCHWRDEF